MAFVLTDVEIVIILAVILILVYVAGSYWKHRTLKKLAVWFEEKFTKTAKVKYASYGHAGLRIRCEMNDSASGFKEMHFALSLGARENLMYYPLRLIAHIPDRIDGWGTLVTPIRTDMRIMKLGDKKRITESENYGLREVGLQSLENSGYVAYASNILQVRELLSKGDLISKMKGWSELVFLELTQESSILHVAAKLHHGVLDKFVNFLYFMGKTVGG